MSVDELLHSTNERTQWRKAVAEVFIFTPNDRVGQEIGDGGVEGSVFATKLNNIHNHIEIDTCQNLLHCLTELILPNTTT